MTYSFSYLKPVCCSMSSSNCYFLVCIQVSQEAGQVVWDSHLFQNFPQCIVIHRIKGFGIVNKAEIDIFLELSCFFDDPATVGNLQRSHSNYSIGIVLCIYLHWPFIWTFSKREFYLVEYITVLKNYLLLPNFS